MTIEQEQLEDRTYAGGEELDVKLLKYIKTKKQKLK